MPATTTLGEAPPPPPGALPSSEKGIARQHSGTSSAAGGYRVRAPSSYSTSGGGIARRPSVAGHSTTPSLAPGSDHIRPGLSRRTGAGVSKNSLLDVAVIESSSAALTGFPARQESRVVGVNPAATATALEEQRRVTGGDEPRHPSSISDDGFSDDMDDSEKPSVEAHILNRVKRARRGRQVGECKQVQTWFLTHVMATWAFALAVVFVALGLLFQFQFPWAAFGENSASSWMYFLGGCCGVYLPLSLAEQALFYVFDYIARVSSGSSVLISELVDFADAARGLIAYIALVVMALLLRGVIFQLAFDPDSLFYFDATMASLLVIMAGLIIKKAALKATLRKLYVRKHQKGVRDVIFYAEVARRVTAPLPRPRFGRLRRGRKPLPSSTTSAATAGSSKWRHRASGSAASANMATMAAASAGASARALSATRIASAPLSPPGPSSSSASSSSSRPGAHLPLSAEGDNSTRVSVRVAPPLRPSSTTTQQGQWQHTAGEPSAFASSSPSTAAGVGQSRHPNQHPSTSAADDDAAQSPLAKGVTWDDHDQGSMEGEMMYGSSGGDDDPGYEDEEDDDGFRIRRVITPTHYLENELFWGQAAYVRTNEFGLTDEEGFVCLAETVEGVAELAHAAYDRLLNRKREIEAKQAVAARVAAAEAAAVAAAAAATAQHRRNSAAPTVHMGGALHSFGSSILSLGKRSSHTQSVGKASGGRAGSGSVSTRSAHSLPQSTATAGASVSSIPHRPLPWSATGLAPGTAAAAGSASAEGASAGASSIASPGQPQQQQHAQQHPQHGDTMALATGLTSESPPIQHGHVAGATAEASDWTSGDPLLAASSATGSASSSQFSSIELANQPMTYAAAVQPHSSQPQPQQPGQYGEGALPGSQPVYPSPQHHAQQQQQVQQQQQQRGGGTGLSMQHVASLSMQHPASPQKQQRHRIEYLSGGGMVPASPSAALSASCASGTPTSTAGGEQALRLPPTTSLVPIPLLTKDDFLPCFEDARELPAAFRLLDLDSDGAISREEFVSSMKIMFTAWVSTQKALESYGGISGAISIMANIIYGLLVAIIVLAVYNVNFYNLYLPISTIIISLSFIVGPAFQRLLDNLLFVLSQIPFENGDKITLDRVSNGAVLTVVQINFLTTEFLDGSGKRIIVRNVDIQSMTISNLRLSPNAAFSQKFVLRMTVTGAELARLKECVTAYVKTHSLDWKPTVPMGIAYGDPDRLEVTFTLTHYAGWSEGAKVGPAVSDFNVFVISAIEDLGIYYGPHPPKPDPTSTAASTDGKGPLLGPSLDPQPPPPPPPPPPPGGSRGSPSSRRGSENSGGGHTPRGGSGGGGGSSNKGGGGGGSSSGGGGTAVSSSSSPLSSSSMPPQQFTHGAAQSQSVVPLASLTRPTSSTEGQHHQVEVFPARAPSSSSPLSGPHPTSSSAWRAAAPSLPLSAPHSSITAPHENYTTSKSAAAVGGGGKQGPLSFTPVGQQQQQQPAQPVALSLKSMPPEMVHLGANSPASSIAAALTAAVLSASNAIAAEVQHSSPDNAGQGSAAAITATTTTAAAAAPSSSVSASASLCPVMGHAGPKLQLGSSAASLSPVMGRSSSSNASAEQLERGALFHSMSAVSPATREGANAVLAAAADVLKAGGTLVPSAGGGGTCPYLAAHGPSSSTSTSMPPGHPGAQTKTSTSAFHAAPTPGSLISTTVGVVDELPTIKE